MCAEVQVSEAIKAREVQGRTLTAGNSGWVKVVFEIRN
jgi:hypothetical protein